MVKESIPEEVDLQIGIGKIGNRIGAFQAKREYAQNLQAMQGLFTRTTLFMLQTRCEEKCAILHIIIILVFFVNI